MKILLVEDEVQMADVETAYLKLRGFAVENAYNGEEALQKAARAAYDVIVMDIMMPVKDGMQTLRELRAAGNTTPVIMLTAKSEIDDRVDGLSAGADDYLTKPFALKELEARVRAQIRRTDTYSSEILTYRNITLNVGEQELSSKSEIRLAVKETRLLEYLIRNAERDLTAQELYDHVWNGEPSAGAETVALYVSYLQGKLNAVSADVVIDDGEFYNLHGR